MPVFYVYVISSDSGVPLYVGKGKDRRWRASLLQFRSILAEPNLEATIVREGLSECDAFRIERELIAAIGRADEGGTLLNVTDGGEGVSNPPRSARLRMSETMKRRLASGPHPWKGKQHSAEAKHLISLAGRALWADEEFRAKMLVLRKEAANRPEFKAAVSARSKGNTNNRGKTLSASTRAKMSLARMGNTNRRGKKASADTKFKMILAAKNRQPHSEETKAKISASNKRRWMDGTRKPRRETCPSAAL